MSNATLDRLLAGLLAAQLATGLLSLRAGVPGVAPLFWVHGLLGGCLLLAVIEKLRRTVGPAVRARRWRRLVLASGVTLLASVALAGGFAWVAGGRILTVGPWTVLTIHVIAALALAPLLFVHLLPRRWHILRPSRRRRGQPISRRALLGMGVVALGGAAAWGTANLLDRLQGGVRRFTGSRWLADGDIPPPTTFFGEPTPPIDTAAWRLSVRGAVARPLELDLPALVALGTEEREAVLDCTSGWAMRTSWGGVPLATVLATAQISDRARSVRVRSMTGWMVAMPLEEARDTMLATQVAGQELPSGNGAPCRLVAPRRRGFDWVKWVVEVEVA